MQFLPWPMHCAASFAKERLVTGYSRSSRFGSLARLALAGAAALLAGCTPSIGDACSFATECSARGDRICDTTQPGGYCTVANCGPTTCPEGSLCVLFGAREPGCATNDRATPRFAQSFCMASCGSDSDCRGEYTCASPTGLPWAGRILDDAFEASVCLARPSVNAALDAGAADAAVCSSAGPVVPAIDAPVRREDAAAP